MRIKKEIKNRRPKEKVVLTKVNNRTVEKRRERYHHTGHITQHFDQIINPSKAKQKENYRKEDLEFGSLMTSRKKSHAEMKALF